MKIAIITNLYKPYVRGGAEVVADQIVEGLRERGHTVTVITTQPFYGFKSLWPKSLKQVYRFYPLNIFYYLNDYKYPVWIRFLWHILDVFNLHSYWVVKRILKKEKPEAVFTHNLKGIGYLIPLAVKHSKIKHIHTLHDVQLAVPSGLIIHGEAPSWQNQSWLVKLYEKINRFLFQSIQVIISPSFYLRDFYKTKKFFPKAQYIILRNPITPRRILKNKGGTWSQLNFGYLGQIEAHKGVHLLLEVFTEYLSQLEPFFDHSLHIAGSGTLLETLKNVYQSEPRIIFYGKIPNETLENFFSKIDVLIFPSLCYENAPAVIAESLSFGVPIIASDIGGAGELIKHGVNGWLFEPNNRQDLLEKLNYVKTHLNELELMKNRAAETVKDYDIANYITALENLALTRGKRSLDMSVIPDKPRCISGRDRESHR
ncbi:MAG: glycosyltransferase family 4 protein [Parcubacteria group bacterium]|nr:glycosyltransferase family 4 protein [Parcubacteria group bacterium]